MADKKKTRKRSSNKDDDGKMHLADRLLALLFSLIAFILLCILIAGAVSSMKNGFQFTGNPFQMFSEGRYNKAFFIVFAILLVVILIFLLRTPRDRREAKEHVSTYVYQKKERVKNQLGLGEGIGYDQYLQEWEESIVRMCRILGIKQVLVLSEYSCTAELGGNLSITSVTEDRIPAVVISTDDVQKLRTQYSAEDVHSMLRFLIGQELTHVRYRDYSERKIALKQLLALLAAIVWTVGGIIVLSRIFSDLNTAAVVSLVILLGIFLLLWKTVCNERYWIKVHIYRADRMGMCMNGTNSKIYSAVLRMQEDRSAKGTNSNKNKKKYFGPTAQKRIRELGRYKKWRGFREYVRYLFVG